MECYDEDDNEPNSYDVFPAERTEKERTTRQARDAAMNQPIKKAQLDGVYIPPRRNTRSMEKLPEINPTTTKTTVPLQKPSEPVKSSKQKENIPPPVKEPIPVDV
jgi:hypothetical protein